MLEVLLNPAAWLAALVIFLLRVGDMALDTVRVLLDVLEEITLCVSTIDAEK